jgi:hypothetical protein
MWEGFGRGEPELAGTALHVRVGLDLRDSLHANTAEPPPSPKPAPQPAPSFSGGNCPDPAAALKVHNDVRARHK